MSKTLALTRFRWLEEPSELDLQRARALYDDLPDDEIAHMQAWDLVDERGRVVYEILYHHFEHAAFYRAGSPNPDPTIHIVQDCVVCDDETLAESVTSAIARAQRSMKSAYLDEVVIPDGPPYGQGRVLTVTKTE